MNPSERSLLMRLMIVLRCAIAGLLTAFYFVPRTFLDCLSPLELSDVIMRGAYTHRQFIVIAFIALLIWFTYRSRVAKFQGANLAWSLTGLYITLFTVPWIVNQHVTIALNRNSLVILPLAIGLLAARLCGNAARTLAVIAGLGALQGVYALYNHLHGIGDMVSGTVTRIGGTLDRPNDLSALMLVCLVVVSIELLQTANISLTAFWALCNAVLVSVLVLTWSRGAFVTAFFATAWIVYRFRSKRSVVIITIVLCALTGLAVFGVRNLGPTNTASTSRSTNGHLGELNLGWAIFEHHWLSGVGLGYLQLPVPVRHSNTVSIDMRIDPQNTILQWMDELGIGGVILLIAFAFAIKKSLSQLPMKLGIQLGAAWIVLILSGQTQTLIGAAYDTMGNALAGLLMGATLLGTGEANKPFAYSQESRGPTGIEEQIRSELAHSLA